MSQHLKGVDEIQSTQGISVISARLVRLEQKSVGERSRAGRGDERSSRVKQNVQRCT